MSWAEGQSTVLLTLRDDVAEASWATSGSEGMAWASQREPVGQPQIAEDATPVEPMLHALARLRGSVSAALGAAAPGWRPRTLAVLAAGPGVLTASIPWNDALADPARSAAYLRSEWQALGHGLDAADRLVLGQRAGIGAPQLVLVVSAALWDAIAAFAAATGLRARVFEPLAMAGAAWALRRPRPGQRRAACGIVCGSSLIVVAQTSRGGWHLHEEVSADLLRDLTGAGHRMWKRAGLRLPALLASDAEQAGPHLLSLDRVVDGNQAGTNTDWLAWPAAGPNGQLALDRALLAEVDARPIVQACQPRRGTPATRVWWVSTALLLAAALALGGAAWQRRVAAASVAAAALAEAEPVPARPAAPPTRAEVAEIVAVNAAVRQINLPLRSLMRTLDPPRDIFVVLQRLDLAGRASTAPETGIGDSGALRIQLVLGAASPLDMTRYVGFLSTRRGVTAAQLAQHEADPGTPQHPLRFAVELTWQP